MDMKQTDSQVVLYGGSGNRAVAFIIDLLLLALPLSALSAISPLGAYTLPLFVFLYLVLMPLTPLQGTLGQWICRIRLCDRRGQPLTWRAAVPRAGATIMWFCLPAVFSKLFSAGGMPLGKVLGDIWWLLFLMPWALIGFRPRRESAFDLIAGSLVVTSRAEAQQIADNDGTRNLKLFRAVGTLLLCLAVGAMLQSLIDVYKARSLHGRIAYAVEETLPLRARIHEFRDQMGRWPTASDLGMAATIPYPDGGHYSLQTQARIVIRFSVLPELKDRSLTFTPTLIPNENRVDWQCSADAGLDKRYLPTACR